MKTRNSLIAAAIVATLSAGASAAFLNADEGVPHNLTALKADEGVPQNLVTA
ncbi:MAG: hypothetical protein H0T52_00425 [Lautropia sp.]|nr:hypothetical protein [Lautropia sp.]